MREVSLVGATLYGNRGAEAMLSATIGELRERDSGLWFNVFSYYPVKDRELLVSEGVAVYSSTPLFLVTVLGPLALLYRLLGVLRLGAMHRWFPRSVSALARSRVLVCLAGISFIDGRTKFLPFNIATILPAMVLGVPVVKFAQAVGPFDHGINRIAARLVLARCHQVFARGDETLRNLQAVFANPRLYQRANDVAFLFRPEHALSRAEASIEGPLARIEQLADSRKVVGLCPSVVVAKRRAARGHDYPGEIAALAERLISEGHAVVLFPNATRGNDMDKLHNNDLPLLHEIADRLSAKHDSLLVLVDQSVNAAQVHDILRACNAIVTSRFHAMVGALACATPVMVLGWSHKYLEVMRLFGQEDMVMDQSRLDVDTMAERIADLLVDLPRRRQQISDALPAVQDGARAQFDYLDDLLRDRA